MNEITRAQPTAMVLRPQNFGELMQFAKMAAASSMVPKDFVGKPENIMLAVQMGSELGLAPMQALQNVAVINGRPAVWGDAMLALCRGSGLCVDVQETMNGEGENLTATCVAIRKGSEPVVRSFSVADAKAAGLLGKPGPWTQYRPRMLQMRARGFALRDSFPDVLKGLISAEEARDIPDQPRDTFTGTTINAEPVAPTQPATPQQLKPTNGQWLDSLRARLEAADTASQVADIVAEKQTQRMLNWLTNGALKQLKELIAAAEQRTCPVMMVDDGDVVAFLRTRLEGCISVEDVLHVGALEPVDTALRTGDQNQRDELNAMLSEAFAKYQPADA